MHCITHTKENTCNMMFPTTATNINMCFMVTAIYYGSSLDTCVPSIVVPYIISTMYASLDYNIGNCGVDGQQ